MAPTRIAVLLKPVPDSEEVVVDRIRGWSDRGRSALRLNPFDARALQVARTVRRPAETVTAIAMGPPSADAVLREALATGVDRAILVTDPALAGSDAQVTSRVLATLLRRVRPDLVVLGARSSDAETGQVPPEIAAHLGLPLVSGARAVDRPSTDAPWEVVADDRTGWSRWRVRLPFVLSVGEKIAKPYHPSEAEIADAAARPVERIGLSELSIAPDRAGGDGSPTRVLRLDAALVGRTPHVAVDGDVGERVRRAFEHLHGAESARSEPALSRAADTRRLRAWIVAINEHGGLDLAALPLLSAFRGSFPGAECTLVIAGTTSPPSDGATEGTDGADRVLRLPTSGGPVTAMGLARGLIAAAGAGVPDVALLVSDPFGREVAGRWAAASDRGLIGDAMGFAPGPDGAVTWWKPAFAGQFEAHLSARGRPALATVRPGVFGRSSGGRSSTPVEESIGPAVPTEPDAPVRVASGSEEDPHLGDLESAGCVVTVGMGIGGREGIDALVPYLARWGAALGGTRRVVDAGWLPVHRQIGLTGRSLAPPLAVLLGVGKAQNHVIGLRRAGRILAVNSDVTAPVFRYVDAGIVAGWAEALPFLDRELSRRSPARPPTPE